MFSTITTAPAKQSVSETISVLSGRLTTATLLEDRRAAIQGLRSFAKQYPASVASGALRSLIDGLRRDGEDVDTVKVILETLLMLFSPNEDSPEASDEIALWLADEFTQRLENIALLLDFLDTNDFYARLYSLQLLSAILSARTDRTEECIVSADLGIPRLVAVLDDPRDAIRDEAISLLIALTHSSAVVQNLVAFERGFERLFIIIAAEGGLADGARVVEECLVLAANLIRLNSPNQAMFREMGFITRLGRLLHDAYTTGDGEPVAQWAEKQRDRNIFAVIAIIRLFLEPGAVGTSQNQIAFMNERVLESTLQLAFSPSASPPIKTGALLACADMLRGNSRLQERFGALQVLSPLRTLNVEKAPPVVNTNGMPRVFVIDGLLDLILGINKPQVFPLRMAACTCLKAYFYNHDEIRRHFLLRAIEGHKDNGKELTNILTTLLRPDSEPLLVDPYRYWFAAVLMLHLVHDSPTTKALAMSVTEGDEASGEEVVTSIQTMTAHLLAGVAKSEDPRISIGYLMLLLCWLFEDLDGVNDFLGEFTNLQGLIQAAIENPNGDVLVQGLSAMLAGVVYEFSTRDSPVPRATVREMITSRMGRDRYVDKLKRLRSHTLMRDHEVNEQEYPDVFLDDTFVEFFKDNYSRILRGIDRDPGLEISVITNGVQRGISRELVDSLRAQVAEKQSVLEEANAELAKLTTQLGQEQADHRRTRELGAAETARAGEAANTLRTQLAAKDRAIQTAEAAAASFKERLIQEQTEHHRTKGELSRLKPVNEALQKQIETEVARHKTELRARDDELQRQLSNLKAEMRAKEEQLQRQVEAAKKKSETDVEAARRKGEQEVESVRRRAEAEKADLKATISRLEVDLMKGTKAKGLVEAQAAELAAKLKGEGERVSELERLLRTAEEAAKKIKAQIKEKEKEVLKAKEKAEEKEEERRATQSELDDLLIVFSDLEEKANKYKERLKNLGETVSDGEEEDDDDDGDEDDEDDEE